MAKQYGVGVIGVGVHTLWKQNRSVAVFVLLMIPAAILPILLIRVVSHTAMLPNLLFPLAWLFGIGLTRVMKWRGSAIWQATVVAVICLTVWMTADASFVSRQDRYDGTEFIRRVDLASLPQDATLITSFDAVALIYAQQILALRPDVTILNQNGRLNRRFLESVDGPVFTTESLPHDVEADLVGTDLVREIRLHDRAGRTGGGA